MSSLFCTLLCNWYTWGKMFNTHQTLYLEYVDIPSLAFIIDWLLLHDYLIYSVLYGSQIIISYHSSDCKSFHGSHLLSSIEVYPSLAFYSLNISLLQLPYDDYVFGVYEYEAMSINVKPLLNFVWDVMFLKTVQWGIVSNTVSYHLNILITNNMRGWLALN